MSYSLVLSLSHSLSHSPSHSLSLPLSLTQSATCSTRNKRAVSTCHARVHHTGCARASATARHTHMVSRCFAHRLERIELLNGHRDELLLQCAQSRRLLGGFLCRTWLMEGDVVSFQPFAAANAQGKAYSEAARGQKEHQMGQPFMSMFAAFVNGPVTENPWRDRAGGSRGGMAEPIPQTAHLGVECGSVSGDVEHSRDPPERETSTNSRPLLLWRMHRTSTSWHTSSEKSSSIDRGSNRKARHHRRTTSERYRVNSSIDARGRRAWKTRTKLTSRNRWLSGALGETSSLSTTLAVDQSLFSDSLHQCRTRSFCCLTA